MTNQQECKSSLKAAIRQLTDDLHDRIAKAIIDFPEKPYIRLAAEFGVSQATILRAAGKNGLSRRTGPKPRNAEQTEVAAEEVHHD